MTHDPVFEQAFRSHVDRWVGGYRLPSAFITDLRSLLQDCVEQCARIAEAHAESCEAQALASADAIFKDEFDISDLWESAQEECSIVADKIREVRIHA